MSNDLKLYCKIFGERNTGTNFLANCLKKNFHIKLLDDAGLPSAAHQRTFLPELRDRRARAEWREMVSELEHRRTLRSDFGWKHSAPPIQVMRDSEFASSTLFLYLVKHPVSWIMSLYDRDYHNILSKPDSVIAFAATEWVLRPRDNIGRQIVPSPLCLWNEKLRRYRAAIAEFPENSILLRYEDLLTDYQGQMAKVAEHFLRRNDGPHFRLLESSTKKEDLTYEDYQKKNERKMMDCPLELLDIVDQFIDSDLAESFQYRVSDWRKAIQKQQKIAE